MSVTAWSESGWAEIDGERVDSEGIEKVCQEYIKHDHLLSSGHLDTTQKPSQ